MEAPEKIYLIRNLSTKTALNTADDSHDKYLHEWYKSREKDADVEYIQTDAFIKKAKKFISELCRIYDITDTNGYTVDYRNLISDYENYMKGG